MRAAAERRTGADGCAARRPPLPARALSPPRHAAPRLRAPLPPARPAARRAPAPPTRPPPAPPSAPAPPAQPNITLDSDELQAWEDMYSGAIDGMGDESKEADLEAMTAKLSLKLEAHGILKVPRARSVPALYPPYPPYPLAAPRGRVRAARPRARARSRRAACAARCTHARTASACASRAPLRVEAVGRRRRARGRRRRRRRRRRRVHTLSVRSVRRSAGGGEADAA